MASNIIYTHILWIHKCLTNTVGYGTSHKYTNMHNFYQQFTRQCYKLSLHIKIYIQSESSVYLSIFLRLLEILSCNFSRFSD